MYWRDMYFPIPAYVLALVLFIAAAAVGMTIGGIVLATMVLLFAYRD